MTKIGCAAASFAAASVNPKPRNIKQFLVLRRRGGSETTQNCSRHRPTVFAGLNLSSDAGKR